MAAEPAATGRPRRSLLVAFGVVAALALLVYWQWPEASPAGGPSNGQAIARTQAPGATDPAALDVRIAKLKTPPPSPDSMERNPFRFQPKPPPPPPAPMPGSSSGVNGRGSPQVPTRALPPQPVGPPPIPLKFIGIVEGRSPGKVAILTDGRGAPVYGHEGDVVLGQYRIVHIGVESVVVEYLDGTGRRTIPLTGQ